jgi:hypothetical protein
VVSGFRPPVADDPQRLGGEANCSQAAARKHAQGPLVRAEQMIQDLPMKVHAVRRERNVAVEAARTARTPQTQAERDLGLDKVIPIRDPLTVLS